MRHFSFIHSMLNNWMCKPLLAKEVWTMKSINHSATINHFTRLGYATAATRPDSSWFAASPFHCASRKAFLDLLDFLSLPLRNGRVSSFSQWQVSHCAPPLVCSCLFLSRPLRFQWVFWRVPFAFIYVAHPSASLLSFLLRSLFLDELHCPFGFLRYYSQHSFWSLVTI